MPETEGLVVLGRILGEPSPMHDVWQWRERFGAFELVITHDPQICGYGRWHWQINSNGAQPVSRTCTRRQTAIKLAEAALGELGAKGT